MALDFPDAPTDGQTVTLQGVRYVWDASNGAWEIVNDGYEPPYRETVYRDFDTAVSDGSAASYQIDGELLICWGYNQRGTITFPVPFAAPPVVVATQAFDNMRSVAMSDLPTVNDFILRIYSKAGSNSDTVAYWRAIGRYV